VLAYALRRLSAGVVTAAVVVTCIFFAMRVLPGDPAIAILGDYASQEAVEALRENLNLNQPLWRQYLSFWIGVVQGDLGRSFSSRRPVASMIGQALPYTFSLIALGVLLGCLMGVPLGVLSAVKRNTWVDHLARVASLIGLSFPSFLFAIGLLYIFSLKLGLFPIMGGGDLSSVVDTLHHLFLPALGLGLMLAAFLSRATRSAMLEALGQDYMTTARSKGLAERVVVYKHALRNALLPVATFVGVYVGVLLAAGVISDVVFGRPGLGRLLAESIRRRDYVVIQSGLMVLAVMVVATNLLTDLVYCVIDPRIRY